MANSRDGTVRHITVTVGKNAVTVWQITATAWQVVISSNGMTLGRDGIGLSREGTQWNGLSRTLDNTLMGLGCTVSGCQGMVWVAGSHLLTFTVMM